MYFVTKKTDEFNIETNTKPFEDNYADIFFLSQAFSIDKFLSYEQPIQPKVDRW